MKGKLVSERKLATIRKIDNIVPIEGADLIECAQVGGWNVVVKKGEFKTGELATYFEIDSWIPKELAPFLFEGKVFEGVEGARLRTKKLRGVVSQGLLLPACIRDVNGLVIGALFGEGDDVTEALGIKKYEKPLDPKLYALARGSFPSFIPKTDQERVQNLSRQIEDMQGGYFEVTIKLDGSSITVFVVVDDEDETGFRNGVCSRNLELKDGDSAFWTIAKQEQIHDKIRSTGRQLAFQGEMLATNIQGNWEKVDKLCMFVYDVYDIEQKRYLLPKERQELCAVLDVPHVPIVNENYNLDKDVKQLLEMAEGEGMNKGVKREGLVFKHTTSDFSFKAISNSYLLKNKDA